MRSSRTRASAGSRYSSTYFIGTLVEALADLLEVGEDAAGLGRVDPGDGDAGVNEDVFARNGFGNAGETDAPPDTRKLDDPTLQAAGLFFTFDQQTRHSQAHERSLRACP